IAEDEPAAATSDGQAAEAEAEEAEPVEAAEEAAVPGETAEETPVPVETAEETPIPIETTEETPIPVEAAEPEPEPMPEPVPELGPKRAAGGRQASARGADPVARHQRAGVGSPADCVASRHGESAARGGQPVRRSRSSIPAGACTAGSCACTCSRTDRPRDYR